MQTNLLAPVTSPTTGNLRALLSTTQDPQIVLLWLTRLRWFAVLGQVTAITFAAWLLNIHLPVLPIAALVVVTVLTNAVLSVSLVRIHPPASVVPVVLVLDVLLLTALLYFTGGPNNPFSTLYVVHVVMAVVVLSPAFAWSFVAATAACYAILFRFHIPLDASPPIGAHILDVGKWFALALEAALITYFIGRLGRSLRQREYELQQTRERAARSEQLASLTTLAAGAAHELGTPLGTIAVVAKEVELAIRKISPTDNDLIEDALLIRRELDRCRKILDRMRVDIVRDIAQQSRVLPMAELFDMVLSDVTEEDRPNLDIEKPSTPISAMAPPRAVQQALGVMIRNAFDASPEAARVRLRVYQEGKTVYLEVLDNGAGMPADVARRAGEPFFTTKAPGKGMGLGLFLVRLVAEQSNGRWYLESNPGTGTRSVLELPAA